MINYDKILREYFSGLLNNSLFPYDVNYIDESMGNYYTFSLLNHRRNLNCDIIFRVIDMEYDITFEIYRDDALHGGKWSFKCSADYDKFQQCLISAISFLK